MDCDVGLAESHTPPVSLVHGTSGMSTHTLILSHTHSFSRAHTHSRTHTLTHTHTPSHAHTHSFSRTHSHTHTYCLILQPLDFHLVQRLESRILETSILCQRVLVFGGTSTLCQSYSSTPHLTDWRPKGTLHTHSKLQGNSIPDSCLCPPSEVTPCSQR